MLDNNQIVKVTNRNHGYTGYVIPELNNLNRNFAPGETKEISIDELRKLSWTPGGSALINNYLIIHNEEAINELVPNAEPEYLYDRDDVIRLLNHGSLDELKDALDFAPDGVVSLIKDVAVDIKVNDVSKREAIKEMTGFDVTGAITINEATAEEKKVETKTRRVGGAANETVQETAPVQPQRRASAPSFSVKKN